MVTLFAGGLVLFAIAWTICSLLRQFFVKTDLDNIPGPRPESFLKGNLGQLFDPHSGWSFISQISQQFSRVVRIYGAIGSKYLYIYDPKAMHSVIVKDQELFQETAAFFAFNSLAFGGGLLSSHGEVHKRQRKMLNPVFSTAHLRNLIPVFDDVARKLELAITAKLSSSHREIDILHWTSRAALEIIGQSALGYSFDPLVEGAEPHPFGVAAKEFSPATDDLLFLREYLLQNLIKIGPPYFRRFIVDHFPWKALRRIRDVIDTMDHVTTQIFEEKKRAVASVLNESSSKQDCQEAGAKDLIAILMKANMNADEGDRLPDKEVLAQMSTFAFAGTDTTSNVLARTLHLLSYHPEFQDKLRDEVTAMFGDCMDSDISYDELMSLPFLDAVCRETLRLHPPITFVTRVATKDYILPLSTTIEGLDGRKMNSIFVPVGTRLFVSIRDINRDPMLWGPDSCEWKPERWLSRLPQSVYDARVPGVYSHMMTFLGGARACIGFKFSELEMKIVLARLISKFHFSPSGKDIVWEMSGISTPAVKGFPGQPQLPIVVDPV